MSSASRRSGASRSSGLEIPVVETDPVRDDASYGHDPLPSRQPLRPGAWIAGRYQILRKIGEGGMGVLYACQDAVLSRQVAVKLLQRSLAAEPAIAERLMREARLAAQLRQHVAQVFDCGMLETGEPYIVMELLSGRDLFSRLRQSGPLAPDELATLMLQVCAGLEEAHEKGIVHRDLKPENLFQATEPDGSVVMKILDFGVSKQLTARRVRAQTNPTESVGSPQYMSPEQITSPSEVDARTDIWSLGVVMFELLTGVLPFNGPGPAQICASVLTEPVPDISAYRTDVPSALEAIVRRCLERNRDQRFPSVRELSRALSLFAATGTRASGVQLRSVSEASLPTPELPAKVWVDLVEPAESAMPQPVRRRRWLGALISIAVLGACAGVLAQGVREGHIRVPSQDHLRQLPSRLVAWGRSLPWPGAERGR